MNGQRLTDAQVTSALRAHLPDHAYPGLRERILDAAEATPQQRALPSVFGVLSDADPLGHRRGLLIAAALMLALALASVAAVGAWRLLQRDPLRDLSLEPPSDVPAFVLSSYDRLAGLPPVALTWKDSGSAKGRIYVDRSGAVRFDRFASAEATEPSSSTILSSHSVSGMAHVGSEAVWVDPGEASFGDDPRVFLRTVLRGVDGPPGCEMERDPSEVGDGTAAEGWRYVSTEYIAGRPAHRVTCGGTDLWLDIETRLILRARELLLDDAGQPIPGQFRTSEVTEIAFGEQPAALFQAPEGVAHMSSTAYGAYLCTTRDLPNEQVVGLGARSECATPPVAEATPEAEPSPSPSVRPDPSDCAVPSPDPSEPTGPLAWTEASLEHDWPAPVRPEPAGAASVLPMPPTYVDPRGDTGSDVLPCIDIRDLTVNTYDVSLELMSNRPPDVDPSKAWIAYGVVVDEDRDGVPDWRYGMDNLPRTAGDENGHHREWRTDLHTGRTDSPASSDCAKVGEPCFAAGYPAEPDREGFRTGRDGARFRFGHVFDATQGTNIHGIEVDMPLYAWASVIVDGRVVATDYAPDTGWLLPSNGAKPGGTLVEGVGPLRISMSVPAGWGDDEDVSLEFMTDDKPPKIACERSGGTSEVRVGPSVDDLVTFLEGLQSVKISEKTGVALKISENTDLMLDGYRGRYLEYTATVRNDQCDYPLWPPPGNDEDNHQAWILDVDGVRLVIHAFGSKATAAELQQIVESIDIGP